MRSIFICIMVYFFCFGCKSTKQEENLPSCINLKIEAIKKEPVRNPPAEVWKWEEGKKMYYYITSDCCDQYNYLYNDNCEVICAPDGGFTGKGDQKCPNFDEKIIKTLIWKDQRKG